MQMEEYEFLEKIGRGTHGTTYLLRSIRMHELVACKSISEKHKKHAEREASILARLKHRRVVRMIDKIISQNSSYLILEYASHGTLESMIQYHVQSKTRPALMIVWSLLAQVSDALYYIHSRRIIHRDIKPSNILVSRFTVRGTEHIEFKICDFSLSAVVTGPISDGHTIGTPFYMAPEMVAHDPYTVSVDVWALGVVLHEMLTLRKPFTGDSREELYESIMNRSISTETLSSDSSLNTIVAQCLSHTNRPTAKQIAKQEKVRLALTFIELKNKERRIEELEEKLMGYEAERKMLKQWN